MAGFDWYQATIPADLNEVLASLEPLDERATLRHDRGMHGYGSTVVIQGVQGVAARVMHGGTHAYPHVILSGEMAQPGCELIRAAFPEHFVTRADACVDFGDPDAFDRIQGVMLGVAQQHRVKVDTRGDHLLTKEGRTLYLGARSSAVSQRLYDKAAELRAKFSADPVRLAQVPEHLARLEAQVRPQTKEARLKFASIEPVEVMGSSRWLRDVWRGVAGLEIDPVQVGKPWRISNDQRAYAYCLAQYGGLLRRMKEDAGSWECLGLQIGHDLAEADEARRKGKR